MSTLIAVDGGAFVGKSSVIIPTLKAVFRTSGIDTISSHEPSDTPRSKELQDYIYSRAREGAGQAELAQLFNQSRKIHLDDVVMPFLVSHRQTPGVCLLDRYSTSTLVFQGLEGGLPLPQLLDLERQTIEENIPAITLILHFPEDRFDKILQSRRISGELDPTRSKTVWHAADTEKQKIRHGYYRSLPDVYKENGMERNIALIDATRHPLEIMQEVLSVTVPHLSKVERYGRSVEDTEIDMQNLLQQYYQEGNLSRIEAQWEQQERLIRQSENTEGNIKNS